jgi:hypothetical protein
MAETINVEVTGKSKYEVAHLIAHNILVGEHGTLKTAGRKAYLTTIVDAMEALSGIRQK